MSFNYNAALSPCDDKGEVGLPEHVDEKKVLHEKCVQLAAIIKSSSIITLHTGAGISTSSGIPDFRGPNGVWTLEAKGETPKNAINFDRARPTFTHRFFVELEKRGIVDFIVSQNVDGLHMRSGFPRTKLAELHGNMFVQKCSKCKKETVFSEVSTTLGLKASGKICQRKSRGSVCGGAMHDSVLDWDDALPYYKLQLSRKMCENSDLSLAVGTSLQIKPAGSLPNLTKKNGGKVVIINLQKTGCDKIADIKIHGYCDEVFKIVANELDIEVPGDDGVGEWVRLIERSKHSLPVSLTKANSAPKPKPKRGKGTKRKANNKKVENNDD